MGLLSKGPSQLRPVYRIPVQTWLPASPVIQGLGYRGASVQAQQEGEGPKPGRWTGAWPHPGVGLTSTSWPLKMKDGPSLIP